MAWLVLVSVTDPFFQPGRVSRCSFATVLGGGRRRSRRPRAASDSQWVDTMPRALVALTGIGIEERQK